MAASVFRDAIRDSEVMVTNYPARTGLNRGP
jgi:hypothetical protein